MADADRRRRIHIAGVAYVIAAAATIPTLNMKNVRRPESPGRRAYCKPRVHAVSAFDRDEVPAQHEVARAMSNGVGLHCPDLTAGTPVYTPDEFDSEEPDTDVAAVLEAVPDAPAPDEDPATASAPVEPATALKDAARAGRHAPSTLTALCRFFCDQPDPARLTAAQGRGAEMADRLRVARDRGLSDARLRALAEKGQTMADRPHARIAADTWLSRRPRLQPGARRAPVSSPAKGPCPGRLAF